MIITDITELSKSKYKIFIDNEFAFVLYKGELRQYGIKKDEEIKKDIYDEIVSKVIPKRAKLRAMHLLEKRPYTERDMRNKLKEGLYDQDSIDEAIDYLKSFGYIDDHAYATQYIDTYTQNRSARRLEQDLMKKGINKDVISEVLAIKRDEGELGDEESMIRSLLEKRGFDPENSDSKTIAKNVRFLYQKGFSPETIARVMRQDF
jgi:regulatory protein